MAFMLHTRPGFVPPEPQGRYRAYLAGDEAALERTQRLRFEVFNLELREGLAESASIGLDRDRFDPVCDHLIVESTDTDRVIGTYRLQTGLTARANHGFYSEQEFDFTPFETHRSEILELGRACVDRDHRNLAVLGLLWRGIARYAVLNDCRYLIGCSSLSSRDPAEGRALYESLPDDMLAAEEFRTVPQPGWACEGGVSDGPAPKIPRLMHTYLLLGAKVCGPPALDPQFGTIDFLTLMDVRQIPARYFR
ncbi:MAG: GNAT family N-acyltransferase [Opitutaceae bacterium]